MQIYIPKETQESNGDRPFTKHRPRSETFSFIFLIGKSSGIDRKNSS